VLLDSHTLRWFVLTDPNLSRAADAVITDPSHDVFVSPASYWEIAIKVRKGKLDLFAPYDDFMQRGIQGNDFEILPIETKHTSSLTTIPSQRPVRSIAGRPGIGGADADR
jgi:PIN domain nuclease of toxin-antitoxin system